MCFRRSDGKKVKDLQIEEKTGPYFMPQRIDAVNLFTHTIKCEYIDNFVKAEKQKTGTHFTYTELLIAAFVRMLHDRPKLNRFVNNCVIYQRNYISISLTIKKKLVDDGEDVVLKFFFKGNESIYDVKKIVDEEIAKNTGVSDSKTGTDKTAAFLCKLPNWMFKFAMALIRFMDKHNMMPKKLIEVSPFHTSLYFTDLRSIKIDKVYHHLYNFGTTSIFAALGKAKYRATQTIEGETKFEKTMDIGFTLDERVADGLYYANSVRLLQKYLENPELLCERLPEVEDDKKKKQKDKKVKKDKKNKKKKEC